ncbi:estradiol 17-beta-dehydrogenase [Thozetella sp. PMI_491]|nr:estradiol 17-beta-dehydrogenase [Thozetella sp. PMI_491]
MPLHNGLLPREGFRMDTVMKILGKTLMNPTFLLPLILLAKYTKKGQDLAILHPVAFSRTRAFFYLGIARYISKWFSRKVLNNWTADKYDWSKEVVLITGGAGGIGGHVVQLLAERDITVVVLDIQPLTFPATKTVHYFQCDITSPAKIAAVAKEIRVKVGDPTIIINNAGVARGKTLLDSTERDIRFTFDVNALAHYWIVQEFLPALVKANHGMVVTVASFATWICVPDMVSYSASKAAAYALHEGLTAELSTRYNAPKVRTVVVNQGWTKTALFTGYNNDSEFLVPGLEPETVADAIVRQVLSGESGQIITPAFGATLTALAAMPHWYQVSLRKRGQAIMTNFQGRQVVADLDKFYDEKESAEKSGEESTVLVPEQK